jgi:2-hydroxychromene-2-carboxylate isomerase
MPLSVDYYMTPVSPFTYMGHERFRQICRQHGAQVNLRVMDLGKVSRHRAAWH